MKNLNKFTKDELIKQYKKLEEQNNNKTLIIKIINYIIYFKSFNLKITLITLIIKWIRKYSLIQKLWHIFSLIGNALLGFTLIDIYSWDVISWIKETSIYKWYSDLFYKEDIISNKKEDIPSRLNEINKNSNENQTNSERSSRIIEWINRDSEKTKVNNLEVLNQEEFNSIEEKTYNANYKYYFILGTLIITTGIVWYYWNDIRPGDAANTIMDKIRSFRSWFSNNENIINDNNPGNNTTNIPTNISPSNEDIQLSDNTNPPNYESINKKGKLPLTSPSLESLNQHALESWSSSSSHIINNLDKSPEGSTTSSIDSNETIKPSLESSVVGLTSTELIIINKVKYEWKELIPTSMLEKINYIESNIDSDDFSIKEVIFKNLADIEIENWELIEKYKNLENKIDSIDYLQLKLISELINDWVSKHS